MKIGKKNDVKPEVAAAEVVVEKPVSKKTLVRAIYGRMVDPTDSAEYGQDPKFVHEITNWMQCQIDANKMEIVEV